MKADIGHLGFNVADAEALSFWRDLLKYLSFRIVDESESHFDATDGRSYLCISAVSSTYAKNGFHRKRIGLNHVALNVGSQREVDEFLADYLAPRGIEPLYGGPKAYPDYGTDYYAVYFEDPSRIKVEVAFDPDSA